MEPKHEGSPESEGEFSSPATAPDPSLPRLQRLLLLAAQALFTWTAAILVLLVLLFVLGVWGAAKLSPVLTWGVLVTPPLAFVAVAAARDGVARWYESLMLNSGDFLAREGVLQIAGGAFFIGLVLYSATAVLEVSDSWLARLGFALTYLPFAPLIASTVVKKSPKSTVRWSAMSWHWLGLTLVLGMMYVVSALVLPLAIGGSIAWQWTAFGFIALLPLTVSVLRSRRLLRLETSTRVYLEGTVSLRVSVVCLVLIAVTYLLATSMSREGPTVSGSLIGLAATLVLVQPLIYTFGKGASEFESAYEQASDRGLARSSRLAATSAAEAPSDDSHAL